MTTSGPQRDDPGLEQEGIWTDGADAVDPAVDPVPDADASVDPGRARGVSTGLAESITSTARMPGPAGFDFADVPNRVIALIVDGVVLTAVGFVLSLLFGGLVSQAGAIDEAGSGLQVGPFVLVALLQAGISLAYFGLGWKMLRGTPGMKLLGLAIGEETEVGDLGWRQVVIRWLLLGLPWVLVGFAAYVPDAIGLLLSVIGIVWLLLLLYTIAKSPSRQGLHDRYAHTVIVRTRRRASS